MSTQSGLAGTEQGTPAAAAIEVAPGGEPCPPPVTAGYHGTLRLHVQRNEWAHSSTAAHLLIAALTYATATAECPPHEEEPAP